MLIFQSTMHNILNKPLKNVNQIYWLVLFVIVAAEMETCTPLLTTWWRRELQTVFWLVPCIQSTLDDREWPVGPWGASQRPAYLLAFLKIFSLQNEPWSAGLWIIPKSRSTTALLRSGCTPPRTCSSLKNHSSAPNHRTDMKLFVYDRNTSKNELTFFQVFFIIKNWQKKYKKKFLLFDTDKIGLKKS